ERTGPPLRETGSRRHADCTIREGGECRPARAETPVSRTKSAATGEGPLPFRSSSDSAQVLEAQPAFRARPGKTEWASPLMGSAHSIPPVPPEAGDLREFSRAENPSLRLPEVNAHRARGSSRRCSGDRTEPRRSRGDSSDVRPVGL